MRFGSVCSGIEAASAAWHPLGWEAAWLSEIEPFPCAVLKHHYPSTPNLGDMTTLPARVLAGEVEAPPLLVGGTPCQSFSVAGLRESLTDARGNLALAFVELANAIDAVRAARGEDPAWVLWENVPGVLSTHDNAFGCLLAGLVGADAPIAPARGKWPRAGVVSGPTRVAAWRVLDAQFFGVAQRRRRVFVLARGGPGRWRAADALLPLTESVRWHPAPSGKSGTRVAQAPSGGARFSGGDVEEQRGPLAFDWTMGGDARSRLHATPESPSLRRAPPAVAFPDPAYAVTGGPGGNQFGTGRDAQDTFVVGTLGSGGKTAGSATTQDAELGLLVPTLAHALRSEGFDASEDGSGRQPALIPTMPLRTHRFLCRCGRWFGIDDYERNPKCPDCGYDGLEIIDRCEVAEPIPFDTTQITSGENRCAPAPGDPSHPLARGAHAPAIAFPAPTVPDVAGPLGAYSSGGWDPGGHERNGALIPGAMRVRRLTPRECERLQGFPDDYTAIPGAKDGPRYRALGNSMAVPVMRHIGRRIQAVEGLP